MNNVIWNVSFIDAYCNFFKCTKATYYEEVLWSCYCWHFPLSLIFKLIAFFIPNFLALDKNLLCLLADAKCDREFYSEIGSFSYLFHRDSNIIKRILHMRLSSKKLEKLKCIIIQ
jgi:hypothetical protein